MENEYLIVTLEGLPVPVGIICACAIILICNDTSLLLILAACICDSDIPEFLQTNVVAEAVRVK